MRKSFPGILIAVVFLIAAWLVARVMAMLGSSMFGEWQLVFQQMQSGGRFWPLAVACAIAVACIFLLLEYERHLISRRLGNSLLVLRLLTVLVLFLTLLEPAWTWSYDQETNGRVVVAVDASESMATHDSHAPDVEKLRWARAMGMIGDQREFERWSQALEKGEEPEWVTDADGRDPVRLERLARARRDNFREMLRDVEQFSRWDLARRAIVSQPDSLLDQLSSEAETEVVLFGGDYARSDQKSIQGMTDPADLALDRHHSDLLQPLDAAVSGSQETRLAGIVIFSDGRDTSGEDQQRLLERLDGLGVPVHTVLVGSELRPRDLSVVHVDHPESIFKDDAPQVKCIVQTSGFEDQEIEVYLEWLDAPEKEPLRETHTPAGHTGEVTFSLDKLDVGRHRFRVRVEAAPNETRNDNNSREFSMNVVDDRAQVLVVEGEGRWEFRFIDNALTRDPRVAVEHVLFEQPFLGILPQPFFPRSLADLNLDGDARTPFSKFDAVIVGDVSPRDLPIAQWRLLEKYVREEGGTLILTAGKRFVPAAYAGTVVDELLPVEMLRTINLNDPSQAGAPLQRGFHLSITPDGERLPMFQLDDDPLESRRIWSELPGHFWGVVGEARGGASVWAAALEPGQKPSLDLERENGLIVQHFVGTGQVVWIGLDSTWRWRFRVGDAYHHRFWGQLVRWAVSFKASAGNENVRLGLRETAIDVGQPATIQARWDDRFLSQHPGLNANAVIFSTEESNSFSQRVELTPQPGNPLIYSGQALGLKPGEYQVRLDVPGVPLGDDAPEATLVVNELLTPELADISANRSLLEEIARVTGGGFFQLNELQSLSKQFEDLHEVTAIREEIPLWSHWLVLVLFCGLTMAEWILRKLNGLP